MLSWYPLYCRFVFTLALQVRVQTRFPLPLRPPLLLLLLYRASLPRLSPPLWRGSQMSPQPLRFAPVVLSVLAFLALVYAPSLLLLRAICLAEMK
jgi:hypothetical protein